MYKRSVGSHAVARLKRAVLAAGMALAFAFAANASASAETRSLKLYNTHTKERVTITFKRNGRYIPAGLREANRFLRDWRRNEIIEMDPELLDLVWEVYQKVGATDYIHVVSSYRSPATNNMLRSRSSGVAQNSQHTLGKAMDFFIPGVSSATLRAAGLRKHVGGVGYYPRSASPFVHLDTGNVRHWPKMSRSQLARVFPDGKTLHIPSDGKRMQNYDVALAEVQSGQNRQSSPTRVASNRPTTRNQSARTAQRPTPPANIEREPGSGGNLFATLFGGGNRSDQTDEARPGAVGAQQTAAAQSTVSPAIENPPVPGRKVLTSEPIEAPVAVASVAPVTKPPVAPASEQVQLASAGQPAGASSPLDARFRVAQTPTQKPAAALAAAARQAAQKIAGDVAVPLGAPADNPVAAIAAATGTSLPSALPVPRPETTLAYAAAAAPQPDVNQLQPTAAAPSTTATVATPAAATRPVPRRTVSGSIPKDQIVDPLAGFARFSGSSQAPLLSGSATARSDVFAFLSHPNQQQLENVIIPGNRFMASGFGPSPYNGLSSQRFDGPAIVVLPVRFAR